MSKFSSTSNPSDSSLYSDPRVAAAILAGGRARRFGGKLKPLLQFPDGRTLIDHLICELRKCDVSRMVISSNTPAAYARFGLEIVPDNRPGAGAAAGIASVLETLQGSIDIVLFVPGDAPAFSCEIGQRLLAALVPAPHSVPAVFAEADGRGQPAMVAVRTAALETLNEFLDCGVRKLLDLWSHLGAHTVSFDESDWFANVNTEDDWRQWLA